MDYEQVYKLKEHDHSNPEPLFEFERKTVETPVKATLNRVASFLLISEGFGMIAINGHLCSIKKGSLLALMPWQLFEFTEVGQAIKYNRIEYNLVIINKMAKAIRDPERDNHFLEDLYDHHVVQCNEFEMDVLTDVFVDLKEELTYKKNFRNAKKKRFSDIYTVSKIFEIIAIFLRKLSLPESVAKKPEKVDKSDDSLFHVFQYIYSHLGMNLSIEEIAKKFFISKSTLSRFIKKTTGITFEALVNEMKITKCLNLLTYTDLSVNEVSELLGYADQSHLANVFQNRMGETPGKYRQTVGDQILLLGEYDDRLFYDILREVLQNYNKQMSAEALGAQFGLSGSKLNEMFSHHLEKSFSFFLNFLRINRACVLMSRSDLSILQISEEVGYNNSKTFLRNFFKFRGMTPIEFKKKLKG